MARTVVRLRCDVTDLVLVADGDELPGIVHFGAPLGDDFAPALFERIVPAGGLDESVPLAILPETSRGWFGVPGLIAARGNNALAPRWTSIRIEHDDRSVRIAAADAVAGLDIAVTVTLASTGAVSVAVLLTNGGTDDLVVGGVHPAIPVGATAGELLLLGGRHAMEFCEERVDWGRSTISVGSRHGRTSHEQLPTVFAGSPGFGETHGEVWGVHLAHSGNHQLTCDGVTDSRRVISAGELLAHGEVVLAPGASHAAPIVVAAYSATGLNGVTRAFHEHARAHRPPRTGARPVVLNTWEAVYFDHDLDRLRHLADVAAACGVERFVLDDGWFRGRRDDTAGLGDWFVDETVWPRGLGPLVEHVRALGMEFGLWVEPEMVNPDSDMFRAHPHWALHDPRYRPVLGRNQLVLDLGRADVRDHLFERLDALLGEYPISHLKWDHNRDLLWPGAHDQTRGFYELLARIRRAHPGLDIESCASGGGRADLGVAEHVQRFWTSDSIDALDRISIQRGFARVLPPEMMGAHIGSPICHTTGRRHALSFRALSALGGWLGIEWNLLEADEHERRRLAEVVSVHKTHRDLLHRGVAVRLDHPDPCIVAHGVVADDASEAVYVVVRVSNGPSMHGGSVRLAGLDPDRRYVVERVSLGTDVWALHRQMPSWITTGVVATGRQLQVVGLPTPPLLPESGVCLRLRAEQ